MALQNQLLEQIRQK